MKLEPTVIKLIDVKNLSNNPEFLSKESEDEIPGDVNSEQIYDSEPDKKVVGVGINEYIKVKQEFALDMEKSPLNMVNNIAVKSEPKSLPIQSEKNEEEISQKNSLQNYMCHTCKRNFSRKDHLKKHIYVIHNKGLVVVKSQDDQKSENKIEEIIKCDVCKKEFSLRSNLNRHMNEKHGGNKSDLKNENFKCNTCEKTFSRKGNLKEHIEKIHNEKRKVEYYICDICEKIYSKRYDLRIHMQIHDRKRQKHNNVPPIECEVCGKIILGGRKRFENHKIAIHGTRNQYECNLCSRKFSTDDCLKRHVRSKHEKLYKCDICGKNFSRQHTLNDHIQVLHEKKSFALKCDSCSKTFKQKSELSSHKSYIHGGKIKQCKLCDKSFKYPEYKNPIFAFLNHKYRHNMLSRINDDIGTAPLNYNCKICDFKPKSDRKFVELKHHLYTVHFKDQIIAKLPKDEPYICPIQSCSTQAKNLKNLILHYIGKEHKVLQTSVTEYLENLTKTQNINLEVTTYPDDIKSNIKIEFQDQIHSEPSLILKTNELIESTTDEPNRNTSKNTLILAENSVKNFKCAICDKEFSKKLLDMHMKIAHDEVINQQQVPAENEETSISTKQEEPNQREKSSNVDLEKSEEKVGNKFLICSKCAKEDDGSPMIGCNHCDHWFHWICIGINQESDKNDKDWFCDSCDKNNVTTSREFIQNGETLSKSKEIVAVPSSSNCGNQNNAVINDFIGNQNQSENSNNRIEIIDLDQQMHDEQKNNKFSIAKEDNQSEKNLLNDSQPKVTYKIIPGRWVVKLERINVDKYLVLPKRKTPEENDKDYLLLADPPEVEPPESECNDKTISNGILNTEVVVQEVHENNQSIHTDSVKDINISSGSAKESITEINTCIDGTNNQSVTEFNIDTTKRSKNENEIVLMCQFCDQIYASQRGLKFHFKTVHKSNSIYNLSDDQNITTNNNNKNVNKQLTKSKSSPLPPPVSVQVVAPSPPPPSESTQVVTDNTIAAVTSTNNENIYHDQNTKDNSNNKNVNKQLAKCKSSPPPPPESVQVVAPSPPSPPPEIAKVEADDNTIADLPSTNNENIFHGLTFKCAKCDLNLNFFTEQELKKHISDVHEGGKNNETPSSTIQVYTGLLDTIKTETNSNNQNQLSIFHDAFSNSEIQVDVVPPPPLSYVPNNKNVNKQLTICKQTSRESTGIAVPHKNVVHQCEKCQKKFTTREYLTIHQENVHKGKKTYKCVKCSNLEFSTEIELQTHFSEKHLNKNVHKGKTYFDQNSKNPEQKNRLECLPKKVLNNDSNIVKVMAYTQSLTNGDSKLCKEIEFERNRNYKLKKKLLELSTEINNKVKISRARNEKIADEKYSKVMAYSQILTKKDVQVRKEVETEMIKNAELKKVLIDLTFDLNEKVYQDLKKEKNKNTNLKNKLQELRTDFEKKSNSKRINTNAESNISQVMAYSNLLTKTAKRIRKELENETSRNTDLKKKLVELILEIDPRNQNLTLKSEEIDNKIEDEMNMPVIIKADPSLVPNPMTDDYKDVMTNMTSQEILEKSMSPSSQDFHIPSQILNKLDGKTCTECGLTGQKRFDTIRHIRNVHLKIKLYECNICDYGNEKMKMLQMHYKTCHMDKMTTNNVTNFVTSNVTKVTNDKKGVMELENDMTIMTNSQDSFEIPEAENVKDIGGEPDENINGNVEEMLENQTYFCDICAKICSSKTIFDNHTSLVHKGLKFSCGFCCKSFRRSRYLQRHMKKFQGNCQQNDVFESENISIFGENDQTPEYEEQNTETKKDEIMSEKSNSEVDNHEMSDDDNTKVWPKSDTDDTYCEQKTVYSTSKIILDLTKKQVDRVVVHEGLKNNVVHKMDEKYLQTNLVQSEEVPMMHKQEQGDDKSIKDNALENDENHSCECGKVYQSKDDLDHHTNTVHKGLRFFRESCAGKSYSRIRIENDGIVENLGNSLAQTVVENSQNKIEKHGGRVETSKDQPVICDLCGKIFSNKRNFNNHTSSVHQGLMFSCDSCDKSFTSKNGLNSHTKAVHKGTKFYCESCGNSYTTIQNLNRHAKTAHKDSEDNKSNTDASVKNITTSEENSTKISPKVENQFESENNIGSKFFCAECGKSYQSKQGLYLHTNAVHKGRKFSCDSCEKKFTNKQSLDLHTNAVHKGIKGIKFSCDSCEKSFSSKQGLDLHAKVVHKGIKFSCDSCEKSFTRSQVLKKHKKTIHGIIQEKQKEESNNKVLFQEKPKSELGNQSDQTMIEKKEGDIKNEHIDDNSKQNFNVEQDDLEDNSGHDEEPSFEKPNCDIHICTICYGTFGSTEFLDKHFEEVHEGPKQIMYENYGAVKAIELL